MNWIGLNTNRRGANIEMLKRHFPRADALPDHQTRQLDWTWWNESTQAKAWVEVSTGNVILIEIIGVEGETSGEVKAELWIAASQDVVDLIDGQAGRFVYGPMIQGRTIENLVEKARARVADLFPELMLGIEDEPSKEAL